MRFILAGLLALGLAWPALAAEDDAPNRRPVGAVGDARIAVGPGAELPLFLSQDWSAPLPGVKRVVIVLHGRLRDADVYFRSALRALQAAGPDAGALMIAPQFLAGIDVEAHHLPLETLRWTLEGWEGGDPALGPIPASSFDALDAIMERLTDRRIFPDLHNVVVAGHSGGAQVVQRYAIAGGGASLLHDAGLGVRYVVANPSSYAYFSSKRPEPTIAAACPGFDRWKYGMTARPPYLAEVSATELEQDYAERRVIMLLGTLDTNPRHPALDRTCMAEAQGPTRYARGHSYFAAMQARHNGLPNHTLVNVDGVGHDGDAMLTSACGLAALFGRFGCGPLPP